MYLDEEQIPSDPEPGDMIIDKIGIVWRWDDEGEDWVREFYELEEMERTTLLLVVKFCQSVLDKAPEGMIEEEFDREELEKAFDFFVKKFGEE